MLSSIKEASPSAKPLGLKFYRRKGESGISMPSDAPHDAHAGAMTGEHVDAALPRGNQVQELFGCTAMGTYQNGSTGPRRGPQFEHWINLPPMLKSS